MSAVRDRKRKMVSDLNAVYLDNYTQTGAEFILDPGGLSARGLWKPPSRTGKFGGYEAPM